MIYTIVFDNESEVIDVVLVPHNQFSPNGDMIDDLWTIENIEQVPTYEVIVFSRLGQEVFRRKNYQNDWDGLNSGRQLLPTTYYFVIRNEKGENVQSGSVNLIR
jgi:gliding motility-associated-like protein